MGHWSYKDLQRIFRPSQAKQHQDAKQEVLGAPMDTYRAVNRRPRRSIFQKCPKGVRSMEGPPGRPIHSLRGDPSPKSYLFFSFYDHDHHDHVRMITWLTHPELTQVLSKTPPPSLELEMASHSGDGRGGE